MTILIRPIVGVALVAALVACGEPSSGSAQATDSPAESTNTAAATSLGTSGETGTAATGPSELTSTAGTGTCDATLGSCPTSGSTSGMVATTNLDTSGPGTSGTDTGETTGSAGLDPDAPPGENFDLAHWKITFPDASEETQEWLVAGNERADEFFTDPQTGGMVFRCPNSGETTSNATTYPRSELREMLRDPGEDIPTQGITGNNWVTSTSSGASQLDAGGVDGHMEATLSVDHVSTTYDDEYMVGRVIVGQIHAPDDEPCKIYYRQLPGHARGSVYFSYEPENGSDVVIPLLGSPDTNADDPADGIPLGERWSYVIDVQGHTLAVSVIREDGQTVSATHEMSAYYDDAWLYFKAGVYNQNNGGDDGDYAQATFYALSQSHE